MMIDACTLTPMSPTRENDIYTEKFFLAADAQQVRSPVQAGLMARLPGGRCHKLDHCQKYETQVFRE